MSDNEEIASLIAVLKKFKAGKPLKRHISHLRFPRFKGLEPGTQINFDFPFTALVGANGIGKSSVLHALWGTPYGYTTAKFWFATDLDPIEGNAKNPQRYVYGHWNEDYKGIVETRKARLGRKEDYWEPYRSSVADGMPPMPAKKFQGMSKDRWNPVRREVVYINFKMTFGSFDRYFYTEEAGKDTDRRAAMKLEARRLKTIVRKGLKSYKTGRRERVFENRALSEQELSCVSRILGRDYEAAQIVKHSLYPGNRGQDLSVVFRRGLEYSEAFAGSGEIAAVSAVVQILNAPDNSLILLDEPETSLHPGAQRALLLFLLEQIKIKHHQVVISTHSSDFLEGLPPEAIKVFEDNGSGQTRAIDKCSPYVALHRLGRPSEDKLRILVEDPLAECIVRRAAEGLDKGEAEAIEIKVAPGGAHALISHHGTAAMTSGDDVYLLIDGDMKVVDNFVARDDIPPARYSELDDILAGQLGCAPKFLLAGGDDVGGHEQAKITAHLNYLDWVRARLRYLPRRCPEEILLSSVDPQECAKVTSSAAAKKALKNVLSEGQDLDAKDLFVFQKFHVAKIPLDAAELEDIRHVLREWIHS